MAQAAVDEVQLRQRAFLRANLIYKTHHLMVDSWSEKDRNACVLNRQLLSEVCNSYWMDIDRKKDFHKIEFADEHKRAGYTVKWLMRFRPVQLLDENVSKRVLLANERLALLVALKKLNIRPAALSDKLVENLLYTFRFRHLDANALAMSFFLLQQSTLTSLTASTR